MIAKIISGGQTGVDRGALDFAKRNGINHGGINTLNIAGPRESKQSGIKKQTIAALEQLWKDQPQGQMRKT